MEYSTRTIRELLTAAFDSGELDTFCYDYFHPVYEQFITGQTKRDRVQMLLVYAQRNNRLEELLAQIKDANPAKYAEFEPRLAPTKHPVRAQEQDNPSTVKETRPAPPEQQQRTSKKLHLNDHPILVFISALSGLATIIAFIFGPQPIIEAWKNFNDVRPSATVTTATTAVAGSPAVPSSTPSGVIFTPSATSVSPTEWSLLPGLAHQSEVLSVVFSSDGQYLASGSKAKTVKVWQIMGGTQPFSEIRCGDCILDAEVSSVAFSSDGKLIAASTWKGSIYLWEINDGSMTRRPTVLNYQDRIYSIAFSPTSTNVLASGSRDGTVQLWDLASQSPTPSVFPKKHTEGSEVWSVAFTPDGAFLASAAASPVALDQRGDQDKRVLVWPVQGGAEPQSLEGNEKGVLAVAFSHDGKSLASGAIFGQIRLWQRNDQSFMPAGDIQNLQSTASENIYSLAFSPDGQVLLTGSEDGKVQLWSLSGNNPAFTLASGSWVWSVAYSPANNALAAGTKDGNVLLWKAPQ